MNTFIIKSISEEDIISAMRRIFPDHISLQNGTEEMDANRWNENYSDYSFWEWEMDIPGAELDDEMEDIGAEDEENNYYSIGGDRHHDLEEWYC